MPKKPPNSRKSWSRSDDALLRQLAKENTPTRVIGLKTGRSEDAVRSRLRQGHQPTNQSPQPAEEVAALEDAPMRRATQ